MRLFTLTGARRHDAAVQAWFSAPQPLRPLAQQWFAAMRACGPDVVKLRPGVPVDEPALQALITAAYADILARLAAR